jgi:hypothetical protein
MVSIDGLGTTKCLFRQRLCWSVRYNRVGSSISIMFGHLDRTIGWKSQRQIGRTLLKILLPARTRWWAEEDSEAPTPFLTYPGARQWRKTLIHMGECIEGKKTTAGVISSGPLSARASRRCQYVKAIKV